MSEHTDGKAILKELVDGLKGVSAGDWDCDWIETESDGEGTYFSHILMDNEGYTIADATNANSVDIVAESDGEGGGDTVDLLASANFKHLARCSPSNIRAIADHVAKLEAERDAALSRAGSLEKVLTAQTNLTDRLLTIVECMEQDIGCERPDVIWPLLGPINDQARALTKDQSND